jgi:hypothetical protein
MGGMEGLYRRSFISVSRRRSTLYYFSHLSPLPAVVLDGGMMIIAMATMNLFHPGALLKDPTTLMEK